LLRDRIGLLLDAIIVTVASHMANIVAGPRDFVAGFLFVFAGTAVFRPDR